MKKRELKMKILKLFKGQEMHGYEVCRRLANGGTSVQLGYLYRILAEMRKEGLIKSYWCGSNQGPKKKIYSVNGGGEHELDLMLKDAIRTVHEFYRDYLAEFSPNNKFLEWESLFGIDPGCVKTTVFVMSVPYFLGIYRKALEYWCRQMSQRPVYLVCGCLPVEFDFRMSNLIIVPGNHTEIPLRGDLAEFTVALDPPKPGLLQEAVVEFHRVTKKGGTVVMGFPNIEENKDSLSLGAFMRRVDYGSTEDKIVEKKVVESLYGEYFCDVRTIEILDFTYFVGKKDEGNDYP